MPSVSETSKPAVGILGVPLGYGASMAGVDMGPAALRVARLKQRISALGYAVRDYGDLRVELPESVPEEDDKLKYVSQISSTCEELAKKVEAILESSQLPLTLGGDHSIAIGSFGGVSSYYRKKEESIGLIWFDAHADMNTGERELIRNLGVRFFTMREIDERGMSACMDDAIKIAAGGSAGYGVTFDVDVLDPGDAPGSGTLVRGGLTYREAHLGMEKIAEAGGMRSLEVVEINTALDVNNKTAELGVELILSALGKTIL